jgi:hypothetical protein
MTPATPEEFFKGHPDSEAVFRAVEAALASAGTFEVRVTKSQIAFRRKTGFAWVWMPGTYLRGERPPLVLTIALRRRDTSGRWKEVVEPARGRFTHHMELNSVEQVDHEVQVWLREAWESAG